jgi:prepilin-type N-terminal cleavage/methylation domain-containing protein
VKVARRQSGFTLIEMLVVISILGILAALTVPALKNLGKSDANISGSQQLLDDVGRARQSAIKQRTTVYMVFVPTNFWRLVPRSPALTNLVDRQLSGYTFVSHGTVGDQPGQHNWNYLAPWQELPDGTLIAPEKFMSPGTLVSSVSQPLFAQWNTDYQHPDQNTVYSFITNAIPFPTATNTFFQNLPCIAFNYLGQLTLDGQTLASRDEYIPLARGSVSYGVDPTTKAPQLTTMAAGAITLIPPGNSTNISYNIVHIDALTGRATLEFYHLK